ncbi:MAG: prepilin-type N-terminal cleavage/methylation domain-containing protein [Proteobacteria bacterium]|nr:prepilin-type N-terminal cleavage/methylation domain-containing protein [Pseudomonadota bacterium]MBU1716267.1 prepilin-type N-terminal cleavage/methylation domain-containing protein [Pseudomonadota bacterium]
MANQKGFTLLEMLIVIIIIGILSSFAIPHYMNMQEEARIANTKGKMAAIRGGLELAHAKILVSGINTGTTGDNPDWPTLEELQYNELRLPTRPEALLHLQLVRSNLFSDELDKALPPCSLPDMTPGMSQNPSGVTYRSLADISKSVRNATEASCWAYYPGDELDAYGRVTGAVFFVNDDRTQTNNVDSADQVPSQW